MPTKAKVYITAVIALGAALLVGSLISLPQFPGVDRYLALVALACIASTLKVRVPGIQGTMSLNFVFILVGVAEASLIQTLLLACAVALVQCMWRTKTQPKAVQVLFNTAALVIASGAAWRTAHLVPAEPYTPVALIPAAAIFFALNSGIVSWVLALLSDKSLTAIWRQCHRWIFPYYVAGAAIAGVVGAWSRDSGWRPALLMLLPLYLIYFYYSELVAQRALAPSGGPNPAGH